MAHSPDDTTMAVFCDFENVALGVRDAKYEKFDIRKVLERLLLKGSIVVKKAYCDWERYKAFKAPMHEAAFEMIEIPHVRQSGKNSADIRLVVDALDLCYTKSHVSTFVIVSGDSDFSPLVSKLRENDKRVIGVGVKNSTSDLLIANCDEFIYYDDLVRERKQRTARKAPARKTPAAEPARAESAAKPELAKPEPAAVAAAGSAGEAAAEFVEAAAAAPAKSSRASKAAKKTPRARKSRKSVDAAAPAPAADDASAAPPEPEARAAEPARESTEEDRAQQAIDLVTGTVEALMAERGGEERIWGSMVKQAIKRVNPGFAESYYGFRSFNALLEEAAARGFLALERDGKSGGYLLRLPVTEE